jgi:hypothetical protein
MKNAQEFTIQSIEEYLLGVISDEDRLNFEAFKLFLHLLTFQTPILRHKK